MMSSIEALRGLRTLTCDTTRSALSRSLLSFLVAATPATTAAADDQHGLQLNLEMYSDDATHSASRNIGGVVEEQDTEVGRFPAFGLSLAYLLPLVDHVRIGPGVRYLSSYRYLEDDVEDESEEENGTLIGRLFEVYLRGEFTIDLSEYLALTPAIDLGIPLLFAAGELEADLKNQERLGYNVNSLPRIGFMVGAELAARYHLVDFLYLRAGLGLLHERMTLYDAEVDDGVGQVSRAISIMRIRAFVGAEAGF